MYLMTYRTDYLDGALLACHALDLPFMFDNVDSVSLAGQRPVKHELADSMSEAWLAFARTGDPNHAGLPRWERYTKTIGPRCCSMCPRVWRWTLTARSASRGRAFRSPASSARTC